MIVRITLLDKDKKPFTMLFGDSYKKWDTQFQEYLWMNIRWWDKETCTKRELFGIVMVEVSKSSWISWGGLKWCPVESFQGELNREGCQVNDNDNASPRKYEEMFFVENKKITKKVIDMYNKAKRHLE